MAAAALETARQIARQKELARFALEQVCSGERLDDAAACYHAEFADHVNATDFHGMEGIRASVSTYKEAFTDFSITVDDQLADGDRVASRWTLRGTSQGRSVSLSGVTISRFQGDRIREDWSYYDSAEVARQLGDAAAAHRRAGR
jgi:predicted ester cyclase